MNWDNATELDLDTHEVFFSSSGDSFTIINVEEFVRNDQLQHSPYGFTAVASYSDGSAYADSSRSGSALFQSDWVGSCWRCDERWTKGDMIGYPEGRSRPVCSSCHEALDTFVPYGKGY